MISSATAAGLIAGMLQATKFVGKDWEGLGKAKQQLLIDQWERAIDQHPAEALDLILTSIATDESMSASWQRLDNYVHESRRAFISILVQNSARGVESG